MRKSTPPTRDAFIEAQVERALARNAGLIPPHLVEEMRRLLRLGLATHPHARALVDAIRPRGEVLVSDKVAIDGDAEVSEAERKGKAQ